MPQPSPGTARPRPPQVAVIGPGEAEQDLLGLAERAGQLLARGGAAVVTGGLGGVMRAACRGAQGVGGLTIGLLPFDHDPAVNEYLSVSLPTGLGEARNALVVGSADAVLCVGCSWGTLSELALARRQGVPVFGVRMWRVLDGDGRRLADGPVHVDTVEEAAALALEALAAGHATRRWSPACRRADP